MRGASNEHMDYMRSRRQYVRTDPLDRLLAKTERRESGCLIYVGRALKNGYPVAGIGHDGPSMYGHRLSYERANGPLLPGLQVHHICETPLCMEPSHLVALTVKEHRTAHGHGVGPCPACGSSDWYIRKDTGARMCRECRRRRRAAGRP